MQVKADLHVHTVYSSDSIITLEDIVFYAKKRGLTAVAITDHNTVEGAQKMAHETDLLIIPGLEVSSRDGHIIGLNVKEPIPRGLSAEETIDKIHAAGGVAVACHPFALFKGSLGKHVTGKFDAVEVINSSAFPFNRCVAKAVQVAERFKLPRVAGTDAHQGPTIGYAYTLIDAEPNVDAVAEAIANGQCQAFGKPLPLSVRIQNQFRFFKKYL
jgi:predicted metal-dependent phosphoesterase TrpH